MSIVADLKLDESRIQTKGGKLYVVEFDADCEPYNDHASLNANAAAAATTLSTYGAAATRTYVLNQFGASGTLDIDIFAQDAAAEEKAFSALATGDFTITALETARTVGAVVKLNDTDDYLVTDWKCIGSLKGTTPRDVTGSTSIFDEEQIKRGSIEGERDINLSTNLLQCSKEELDFVLNEARDKYFALKYVQLCGSLGVRVRCYRKVKLIPEVEESYGGGDAVVIPIKFEVITVGTFRPYEIYEG